MLIKKIIDVFFLIVLAEGCCYATEHPEVQKFAVDIGENLTLPCTDASTSSAPPPSAVMWEREGRAKELSRIRVQGDGSLSLTSLDRDDAGIYSCVIEIEEEDRESYSRGLEETKEIINRVKVEVRTPPPPLTNVTVHPSTVLALLLWDVVDDGGYPILNFQAQYRLRSYKDEKQWHHVMPAHISPNVRQIDVYHLKPNSTYVFQIWASNKLGPGEVTQVEATTLHNTEEIQLARRLLEGAENFDTRIWVVAVIVVMGTLAMLAIGTCYLLYRECRTPSLAHDSHEIIELVPNIILNPGYDVETMEHIEPDENSNDQTALRINNNTVVQPVRV